MPVATQVTFIGSDAATHWATASPQGVAYPAGIESGDLILLQVRANSDTVAEEWSPGASGFRRRAADAFANGTQWIYARLADGTESGSVAVEFSGTAAKSARMYRFTGNRGDTFVDLQVATGTGNSISHDDVRAHASGRLAVALVSYGSTAGANSFGGETGGNWVEDAQASSGTGGNRLIQLQTAQMTAGTLSGGSFNVTSPGRWIVHTFALAPQAAAQSTHLRVSVEDPDGVMRDLRTLAGVDWQLSASYEHNIDAPVSSATVTLFRADNPTLSLATLVVASTLNRNALGQYAPFLHASRRITIETAVIESAVSEPFAEEWHLELDGYIDRVDTGGDLIITVQARDQGSVLQTEWVKEVTTYGDDGGAKTAHAVITDILNDWVTDPPTLFVPTAPVPPVLIHEYQQQKMSVMDAIKAVATGHGWDVRYLFDEGTGQWRLTYFEPQRDTNEITGAFTADDYTIVDSLAIFVEDIRNDGSVIYTDGGTGQPAQVAADDPVSIAKWGGLHRFFEFEFGPDSPIDTASEATALLDGALSDLSEPFAEQQVTFPFNPDINIGRLYEFLPNDEQYDETQRFAPSLVRHEIAPEGSTTTAFMRGKVAGQFKAWLRNESGTAPPKDGVDGLTTEFRFFCSPTQPSTPFGDDPAGWTVQPPTCISTSFLWQSSAQRNARTGSVVGDWTTPVRVTGQEGPQGPPGADGEDGTAGPSITRIWEFPGSGFSDVLIQLDHSENDGGTLSVWVNPSGTSSPDPEAAPDGSVGVGSTPFTADDTTVFGGAGQLLNNVPVSALENKTIFARFTDTEGRVATAQHVLRGGIPVIDPFGILTAVDPNALVVEYALQLVTNPNIAERAVSFRNLVIGSYDNLISDPSFEAAGEFGNAGASNADRFDQAGWDQIFDNGGTWSTTSTNPAAGTYAAIYQRAGQTADSALRAGGANTGSSAGSISAKQGDRHYLQAGARMSGSGSGGQGRVNIIYRDASGAIVAQHDSPDVNLTFSYQTISIAVPENDPAPAGTAAVQFGIAVVNVGTIANILWDDCFARLMVDGTLVVDGAILAKHLSAGSVTTVALAARAATFEKVTIGSLGNMIPDPGFESGDLAASDWSVQSAGGGEFLINFGFTKTGQFALQYTRAGQTSNASIRHTASGMDCNPGENFHFDAWFAGRGTGSGTDAGVVIGFLDAAGAVVGVFTDFAVVPKDTYAQRSVDAAAPVGAVRVAFDIVIVNDGTTEFIRVDDCFADRKVDRNLIVDGEILARHVTAAYTMEVGQLIESSNYVAGSSGWRINSDGTAEFDSVILRATGNVGLLIGTDNTLRIGRGFFAGDTAQISSDLDTITVAFVDNPTGGTFSQSDLILGGPDRTIGFYGQPGTARPAITGSRSGGAALTDLLASLDNQGLIDDQTTV